MLRQRSMGFQPVPHGLKARATTIALLLFLVQFCQADTATAPSDSALEKRVADITNALKLDDPAKTSKVRDILIAQYQALRDWQSANEVKLKDKSTSADEKKQIIATRQPLHDQFIAKLNEQLTPEQVELVKDKMTYNKLKVTYDGYVEIVGKLNDEQKAKIMEILKQGREEAMDGTSSEEKSAIFKQYKGKVNIYLSSQGIDMKQATKDWGERQKAKKAATTQAVRG
jgi:hypothetical protein